MKLHGVLLFIFCAAFIALASTTSDEDREKAVDKSSDILAGLYTTLRSIAFPQSPYNSASDAVITNRFILMSPGKVLNYYDYYPGDEYTVSFNAKNMTAPETLVPPSVMEKWFDIADVVVGGELNGGITGKQFSVIYRTILSQMSIKNFRSLYADAEARYNEAKSYLTEPVQNPVNLTENTTRMFLYTFYQEEYAQRRLDMEETINNARNKYNSLAYELWFQRNYKMLNAKVESAYSKWLVFGQKDLVELYKTFMDTTSAGEELEDARIILRASGVDSLDRTRTIYPVSFEPGNWYQYLLPKKTPVSRDMLIAKRSMLQSEVDALKTAIKFTSSEEGTSNETVQALQHKVNITADRRDNATNAAMKSREECMKQNAQEGANKRVKRAATTNQISNPCDNLKQATDDAVDATFQNAQAASEYFSSSFLLSSNTKYQSFLNSRINSIKTEISDINDQLDNLKGNQVYLGGIADSNEFDALNRLVNGSAQDLDSEWLQFEYDYDASHINSSQDKKTTSVSAGFSYGVPGGASIQASAYYGKATADLAQALNSASLKASGQLLRVTVKRPWFRPSLFENSILYFIQTDSESGAKSTYVSPPAGNEMNLCKYINGQGSHDYLLSEYVTSFLLARDVKLQFSGLDSSSISHGMQMMAGGSISGSYGPFGLSASVGVGREKQSITADRTANGMIIRIPGAQIIGYYTQVLPQFPKDQN